MEPIFGFVLNLGVQRRLSCEHIQSLRLELLSLSFDGRILKTSLIKFNRSFQIFLR